MKQAILELIGHWHDLLPYPGNTRDYMETLYDRIEKMDEWIPVTERLPELEDNLCLVYYPNGSIETVHIQDYFGDITAGIINGEQKYTKWYIRMGVTHWQPLPLPPNN